MAFGHPPGRRGARPSGTSPEQQAGNGRHRSTLDGALRQKRLRASSPCYLPLRATPSRIGPHAASCTRTGRFWPRNRVLAQKGGVRKLPQRTSPTKGQVASFGRVPKGADPCQNAVSWPKSRRFRARAAPRRTPRRAIPAGTATRLRTPRPQDRSRARALGRVRAR